MNINLSHLNEFERTLYNMRDKIPDYSDLLSPLLNDFSEVKEESFQKQREAFERNKWKYSLCTILDDHPVILFSLVVILYTIITVVSLLWVYNPLLTVLPAILSGCIYTMFRIWIDEFLEKYKSPPSDYYYISLSNQSKQISEFLNRTVEYIQRYSYFSQNDILTYILNHHDSRQKLNSIFTLTGKDNPAECQRLLKINFGTYFQTERKDIMEFLSEFKSFEQNKIRLNENLDSLKLLTHWSECETNDIVKNLSNILDSKTNDEILLINHDLEDIIRNICSNPDGFSIQHLYQLQNRYLKMGNE